MSNNDMSDLSFENLELDDSSCSSSSSSSSSSSNSSSSSSSSSSNSSTSSNSSSDVSNLSFEKLEIANSVKISAGNFTKLLKHQRAIESQQFSSQVNGVQCSWTMSFHPGTDDPTQYMSLYVCLTSDTESANLRPQLACLGNGYAVHRLKDSGLRILYPDRRTRGFLFYVPRKDCHTEEHTADEGLDLEFYCEIEEDPVAHDRDEIDGITQYGVFADSKQHYRTYDAEVFPCDDPQYARAVAVIHKLYLSFAVRGMKILAHRDVLQRGSGLFAALFRHPTFLSIPLGLVIEVIDDIEVDDFVDMLKFMYVGELRQKVLKSLRPLEWTFLDAYAVTGFWKYLDVALVYVVKESNVEEMEGFAAKRGLKTLSAYIRYLYSEVYVKRGEEEKKNDTDVEECKIHSE